MKRKHFLSSLLTAGAGAAIPAWGRTAPQVVQDAKAGKPMMPRVPDYLSDGDTIGITCPAGCITLKEIEPAMQQIESWGFKIKVGDTVGKKDFSFGGTDAERAADLQRMIDDPGLKAILCARGGYGSVRIVDKLDFSGLSNYPKWIIGFSDITVLLCHIHRNVNMAAIHSKMCNSFPDDWSKAEPVQIDSILSIRQALTGDTIQYPVAVHEKNRTGVAEGQLVGGNLKTIETLSGSRSDIDTVGKILFVEDTGEYLYSIDRMFWNLERTGKLAGLQGLIVGGFKIKPDDPGEEFGRSLYDIVLERVGSYNFPVAFDFPVGHQKNNYALKYGMPHRLTVTTEKVVLEGVAS
ncbi:MAG TPA: LD-carboxypeptidase [Puia sp.]|jgi:muramoyltetrapeptide carboxypeptidase